MIVIWIFVNLGAFIKKPMPTNVFVLQHSLGSCFTIKVLFCVLLRQATGLVESLLKLIWLNWPVPDLSTLCRR